MTSIPNTTESSSKNGTKAHPMDFQLSRKLFAEALNLMPGGVNSPVRAFRAVGGQPFFVQRGKGSKLYDVDGNEFIDYVCTWGPSILGHAHVAINRAIYDQLKNGTSFGAPHTLEIKIAKLIQKCFPSIQKLRMCNSGTEATMSCIRLARGFTKRDSIIKFEGCYHGHVDSLLVKAGSGALTFGQPDSAGVPSDLAKLTITLPYNDLEAVTKIFKEKGKEIAAIILEPIPANAGLYLPKPGYLEGLRKITKEYESLLIFDEVMTGFRLAPGGAQEIYKIDPDLTALGKIIGGGLPVGAFGGKAEIMNCLAPLGPVYQAGTLSGNPLALAAGIANVEHLISCPKGSSQNSYTLLEERGAQLEEGLKKVTSKHRVPVQFQRIGSMFCGYFCEGAVHNLTDAKRSDTERFSKFFNGMLERGIYIAPSQFEAGFISTAHSEKDIEATICAADEALSK
jgi:glutamate-1-semialdehyde 2,1-aminomutase